MHDKGPPNQVRMMLPCLNASLQLGLVIAFATALFAPVPTSAQTDYYNTDAGRPLRIEDAYPVERRAFEIQAAPLRLERSREGIYNWGIEPELAFGILPRTQFEIGFPFAYVDAGVGGRTAGLAGIEFSALYNLNAETEIPALALATSVILPIGGLAPDDPYFSVKGIATRTLTWMRFHLNGEYTFGPAQEQRGAGGGEAELSRWMAGVAGDRTFPLQSMLLTAEVFASEPLRDDEDLEWSAGGGIRYQLSPRLNLDAGIDRRLTGEDRGRYATFGTAYALGLPWRQR